MGFLPLRKQPSNLGDMQDIPLRQVKSNASSHGARRADQTLETAGVNLNDEKDNLFHTAPAHGHAGRRRVQKDLKRAGSDMSEEASLNAMGRFYQKIVTASFVTRYLVYVVPVALLLAIPLLILPFTGNQDKDRISLGEGENASLFWLFVWIEISWLSLWVGKLVARLIPPIFMFFCGVVSSGTRKYATVLRALEIPLSLFFWGLASWISFKLMFTNQPRPPQWTDTLNRLLLSLFLSSAVLLGEKTIVQLISITYHQRSFANRIQDSKREIYLLGLMYEASRTLFPMYCPEFSEEDYVINDSIELMLTGKKKGKTGGSSTPIRLVGDVSRLGDKITSVFGNIASEITGKQVFNPNSAHSIVVEALEKVRSSEAMARRIWMSFVVEGSDSLSLDDIAEVLGPLHRQEAEECFAAIDADQNGDISLDEMIRKVVDTGKERKAISSSMKDISQALTVFDKVLLFVVLIIVIIIFLAVFQSSFIATLTTAGTTLLSLSFVFAVTTQEFLGSCIFLFVKHPYDVADRVDIQGPEKQQLVVEKISLLYTVFTRIDKMQVVQVPNIQLNNLWIENVTRSKAMKETFDVNVAFDTSFEDIELLRLEMEKFVRAPDNSRDFQPDVAISVGGVGDLDKLTLKVTIKHKSNWHNEAVRASRRSKFMCALTLALRKVPIIAPGGGGEALGGPKNPTYAVAVTDEFAAAAREKADKEKEAKKLANELGLGGLDRSPSSASSKDTEHKAVDNLTASNPASDGLNDWGYDETLASRDPSAERRRATSIEAARRDFYAGRESQRGRRKAGDTLPAMPLGGEGGTPGLHLTRASTGGRAANMSFDIERQAGLQRGPSLSQYPSSAAYPPQQHQSQTSPGMFSPLDRQQQQHHAGYSSPPPPPPPPAATLSPDTPLGSQTPTGARSRGASVTRALLPHMNQQQQQQQQQQGQGQGGGAGPSRY